MYPHLFFQSQKKSKSNQSKRVSSVMTGCLFVVFLCSKSLQHTPCQKYVHKIIFSTHIHNESGVLEISVTIRNLILEMGLLQTIFGIFTSKKKLSKDFINCHPYTLFSSPEPKAHKVNL